MSKNKCICCDEISQNYVRLHKTRRQTHSLCIDCAIGYIMPQLDIIRHKLCSKNKFVIDDTITCPGTYHGNVRNQCKSKINIRNIFVDNSNELYIDLFRIIYVLDNPTVRICPNKNCGNVVEALDNCVECVNCNCKWCKWCYCVPYHNDMNCIEYEYKTSSSDNDKHILELYKQDKLKFCPKCNSSTTKDQDKDGKDLGCNKITCIYCNINWCWLCGKGNIDYDHFNSEGIGSCANKLWLGTKDV
jgi:hypothetical protein